jgi:hypothetical protein
LKGYTTLFHTPNNLFEFRPLALARRVLAFYISNGGPVNVEITKALAALQPLYGKDNVEIITTDGRRVRGTVRSMKTTQALTTPSVKILCPDGQIVKIPFPTIAEIKDHNV